MFVPIPDVQLPNGGEIHANSTWDAEGKHAVVLHFTFPAAFPLDVVLPAGFHICKHVAQEVDAPAPADPFAELETWGCPECAGTGRNEYWLKCHLCHGHGVLYRRPASA